MSEPFDPSFVASVIEHMNLDHADAVLNSALAFVPELHGLSADDIEQARMTAVDASGIGIALTRKSGIQQQFNVAYAVAGLPTLLEGPEQVRSALVTMAKKARIQLSR